MKFDDWYSIELDRLQERIGYIFDDISLLRTALLHSSHVNEHGGKEHNERLEFLGDAVLQLSVSNYLFKTRDGLDEGILSKKRASIVCGVSLRSWSENIGIASLLRTGKGMAKEILRSSMCADAVEAVFGAVFLDGGFEAADSVIRGYLDFLFHASTPPEIADPKSSLQILAQEKGIGIPSYEILSVDGPSHEPEFFVRVLLAGVPAGEGRGASKKAAEFNAAKAGYAFLSKETVHE